MEIVQLSGKIREFGVNERHGFYDQCILKSVDATTGSYFWIGMNANILAGVELEDITLVVSGV